MKTKTLDDLRATEGGRYALAIVRKNKKVRWLSLVSLLLMIACFLAGGRMPDDTLPDIIGILIFVCGLLLVKKIMGKNSNGFLDVLDEECDPYKAEDVFATCYYVGRDLMTKLFYYLCIARSITFQGDYERALQMLREVRIQSYRNQMRYKTCLLWYYDTLRLCYAHKGETDKLEMIAQEFRNMQHTYGGNRQFAKTVAKEIDMIALELSLQAGRTDEYDRISGSEDWRSGSRLTAVTQRWTDVRAARIRGDREAAKAACRYVVEHGNRLWHVADARDMLRELEATDEKTVYRTIHRSDGHNSN